MRGIIKKISPPLLFLVFLILSLPFCSESNQELLKVSGIVDGDIITLKSIVTGNLELLNLKEGQNIKKEHLVAQINSEKIENQLQELVIRMREIDNNNEKTLKKLKLTQANIKYLQKQVNRFKRLTEKKALPGEKLENMELQLLEAKTTQFQLQKILEDFKLQKEKIQNKKQYLQLLLKDHHIYSPADGVVVETFVCKGETVFPGTAIADILDTSSLYVDVYIEQQEMSRLKLGQEVSIQVDGKIEPLSGRISFFGNKAEFSPKYIISEKERKSLLYQVKIKIETNHSILKMGMPVTVHMRPNS